jgi:hypothetical protein
MVLGSFDYWAAFVVVGGTVLTSKRAMAGK